MHSSDLIIFNSISNNFLLEKCAFFILKRVNGQRQISCLDEEKFCKKILSVFENSNEVHRAISLAVFLFYILQTHFEIKKSYKLQFYSTFYWNFFLIFCNISESFFRYLVNFYFQSQKKNDLKIRVQISSFSDYFLLFQNS